jgi:hypothetical protein
MPTQYVYPELRPAAIEAEARELRRKAIPTIAYRPTTPDDVSTHLAIPGSIAVFVARKGSRILEDLASAATSGDGSDQAIVKRLYAQFGRRKRTTIARATAILVKEPVFADVRHGGATVASNLFQPKGLDCAIVLLPYNGGKLAKEGLQLVERFVPPAKPGDPSPELEAVAIVHVPALTRAEREALRQIPASQLELNVGKAADCWGVTAIAVAAVVVLLVVAIATAGCAAVKVKPLEDEEIAKLGPLATARQLVALRRDAIDGIARGQRARR